jgi:chitodextrinase
MVALDASTGGVLDFAPLFYNGLKVWDIQPSDVVLRVGGGFNRVNTSSLRQRYAEFPSVPDIPDGTPPSVPANLHTTNVSDTIVSLAWSASTDDHQVAGYRLWRDGQVVAPTGVTNYTDRDLQPSTTYNYQVQASDASGNWSDLSDPVPVTTAPPSNSLVKVGSAWRFLSDGSNQGTAWSAPGFNDSGWSVGNAQLGYGDSDESTVIAPLGLTSYFRQNFNVTDASTITGLTVRLLRDDGAVVYVNGTEVWRSNMPTGPITYQTPASTDVSGSAENTFFSQSIPTSVLHSGTNTIAVEVHNRTGSPDLSFDLELVPTF